MEEPVLKFSCEFPIKVVGLANEQFEITVLSIVHKHSPQLKENAIATRYSENKKYLAITITLDAVSQEQLDALYTELSTHPDVLMML